MAVSSRVSNSPAWSTLQQAETVANGLSEQIRLQNPQLVDRTRATLAYLRLMLEQGNGDVIADTVLSNFHSWTQQIIGELSNAQTNPASAPQFLSNVQGAVDAIAQNVNQIPAWPGPAPVAAIVDEAQARLDHVEGIESEIRERARLIRDQLNAELEDTRSQAKAGLNALKERGAQADTLLAELGAKGTSTQYLNTAAAEKRTADGWRWGTILSAIVTAVASFISGHDLETHSASDVAARLSILLPLILVTIYAGRQSAEHRSQERRARTLGLQLASLGAFLVDLGEDRKGAIKANVAAQIFAEADGKTPLPAGYPSSPELLQLLADALSKVPRGT